MLHGVKPVTWVQVMLEWQRDWNRYERYDGVMEIAKNRGAYGAGVEYAFTMLHGGPRRASARRNSPREVRAEGFTTE